MIVDLRGVETGHGNGGEEKRQQIGAGLGQLVENERGARDFGEDGEQAGAGRRLEHPVGRGDGGGVGGDQAERDRRRELLERLAFRRTPRMRRQQAADLRQRREPRRRSSGFAEKRMSVFAQEQDGRGLAGVIGRLPVPGAGGVGGAEGGFHRRSQGGGVNALAAFEMRQELAGGREDGGGGFGIGAERKRRGGDRRRGCGHQGHGETSRRAGVGKPARRSLSRPHRLEPVPAALSLSRRPHEKSARP